MNALHKKTFYHTFKLSHFFPFTLECISGDIRLSGGGVSYEGRVEYCYQSSWGTVCDDFWGTTEAAVVCSQLGYPAQGIYQSIQLPLLATESGI